MDAQITNVMRECTEGSDSGRLTFPQVVMKLTRSGVERYHADLQRAEKTYYMPNGESHVVPCETIGSRPAEVFSPADVASAIRAIQAGTINYTTFCNRIVVAGCVGYFVSMIGQRAVYYGRTGDFLVEPFPAVTSPSGARP
jgi:uncharacterized protein YbcV (DUF1398 family)